MSSLEETDSRRREVDGGARGRGRDGGGGVGGVCNGDGASVWEGEKVLERTVGMVAQQCDGA